MTTFNIKHIETLLSALLFSLVLAGCSSFGGGDDSGTRSASSKTADELYLQAKTQLAKESYTTAIDSLKLLEAQYPFTPEATQGQLDLIYAYYKTSQAPQAVSTARRFISLHPQHPKADYAYYMVGLANFEQSRGRFERYLPVDISRRDLGRAKGAFSDFSTLIKRYPNSQYNEDAKRRMIYLRNIMARYEINVANYYFKREAYLAAANRGRYVVENYPQTQAVGDALAVMTQAYVLLGMEGPANDAFAILKTNFPDHPSVKKDGTFDVQLTQAQAERGFLNKISLGLINNPAPPKFNNRPKTAY